MIYTNRTDASKSTAARPKAEERKPTQEEMERAALLAAHDLIQRLENGKVLNHISAKNYFDSKFEAHIRSATIPRPELKGYREAMRMNWNEFTSYVVSAARYVCYSNGGDSGGVCGIARKMYGAGIDGVERCTGQYQGRKAAFKFFNDIYLHEIYVGAVNVAVCRMVKECDNRLTVTQNKTAAQIDKAVKNEPKPLAVAPVKPASPAAPKVAEPQAIPNAKPAPAVVHAPKSPILSAPVK